MITLKALMKSLFGIFKSAPVKIRCPVDETGMNSVKPSINAKMKTSRNVIYIGMVWPFDADLNQCLGA
jgi:hypothetical protein